jgi:hypothetical protein
MGLTATSHQLSGWTPIRVQWDRSPAVIRWYFTGGIDFSDPFFDQTIERCLRDPFRLLFWRETEIDDLAEFAKRSPGLQPAGFIFHMSRSGSTLVAQMLAGLGSTLVVSEAPAIDAVLRAQTACPDVSERDLVDWLGSMVSALGQRRRPGQRRYVIKLDAWAILQLPLIRMAFPQTPCVFVYRDPVEVVVSHLNRRGYHMIPGTLPQSWVGLSSGQAESVNAEQYVAAVLARLCEAALGAARAGQLTLIPYCSLPGSVPETVAPLFGIDVGPSERAVFAGVAARDAKNPAIPFVADAIAKQRRATAAARAAVDASVGPVYESLERLREARS